VDSGEDWVRSPISKEDLEARVRALSYWADARKTPILDSSGTLYFSDQSLILSNTQAVLMEVFVARFGEVVYRQELERRLAESVPSPTRNSLDLHIMRLRRRLARINLCIRTAWGRGYLLELRAE
jgi:DNA-binding response OmpR family regulator